jgi:hypothetical protein
VGMVWFYIRGFEVHRGHPGEKCPVDRMNGKGEEIFWTVEGSSSGMHMCEL